MWGYLLDIQPEELKFIFELKKQSSCSVQLHNNSNHYVAFKVKTTSPKKYSVRPNIGIIEPKSACGFIGTIGDNFVGKLYGTHGDLFNVRYAAVTMQAQRIAPPDMTCKDKFLVQSTVVPAGTTEEEITSSMFSKDDGRPVEERKLRVILASPPDSPVLSPVNGVNNAHSSDDDSIMKDQVLQVVGNDSSQQKVSWDIYSGKPFGLETVENLQAQKDVKLVKHDPLLTTKAVHLEAMQIIEEQKLRDFSNGCILEDTKSKVQVQDQLVAAKPFERVQVQDQLVAAKPFEREALEDGMERELEDGMEREVEDAMERELVKDIDATKSKISQLESMLNQAEVTISKLRGERLLNIQERESFQKEMALLRTNKAARKVVVGFPPLFVCMVALVSVFLGYFLHL